jgi:hypothetical protein
VGKKFISAKNGEGKITAILILARCREIGEKYILCLNMVFEQICGPPRALLQHERIFALWDQKFL